MTIEGVQTQFFSHFPYTLETLIPTAEKKSTVVLYKSLAEKKGRRDLLGAHNKTTSCVRASWKKVTTTSNSRTLWLLWLEQRAKEEDESKSKNLGFPFDSSPTFYKFFWYIWGKGDCYQNILLSHLLGIFFLLTNFSPQTSSKTTL